MTPFQHYDRLAPFYVRGQKTGFEMWRREQARREYREAVGQLPTCDADAWKDDPGRPEGLLLFAEDRMRVQGRGEALTEIKDRLRDRWGLRATADIRL